MRARRDAPGHGADAGGGAQHYGLADPRDNPLVLVETALGVLVAAGVATRPAAGLLAAALAAEAGLYWRWWGPAPHAMYRWGGMEGRGGGDGLRGPVGPPAAYLRGS
jgi:uncharacterized membrane protein YphA (DoxX/SURF4 family)